MMVPASISGSQSFTDPTTLRNSVCTPFVGREEILQDMMKHLPGPEPFSPPIVVVEGESGIGKTRLLTELVERTQKEGVLWLATCCVGEQEQAPCSILLSLIREFIIRYPGLATAVLWELDAKDVHCLVQQIPEATSHIPPGKPSDTSAITDLRESLPHALGNFLRRLSMLIPLGLCLDQFQHVDVPTLSVLLALQARTDARVAVFAALTASSVQDAWLGVSALAGFCRQGLPMREHFLIEVPVPPLNGAAISQMISGIFRGRDAFPEFDEVVYRLSRGNPLRVETILKDMMACGLAHYKGNCWQFALPREETVPALLRNQSSAEDRCPRGRAVR